MGVALATVADNGNLLGLDQIDVGVSVIKNSHGDLSFLLPCPRTNEGLDQKLHFLSAAGDGDDAGPRHIDEPEGLHKIDEFIDCLRTADHLEHE